MKSVAINNTDQTMEIVDNNADLNATKPSKKQPKNVNVECENTNVDKVKKQPKNGKSKKQHDHDIQSGENINDVKLDDKQPGENIDVKKSDEKNADKGDKPKRKYVRKPKVADDSEQPVKSESKKRKADDNVDDNNDKVDTKKKFVKCKVRCPNCEVVTTYGVNTETFKISVKNRKSREKTINWVATLEKYSERLNKTLSDDDWKFLTGHYIGDYNLHTVDVNAPHYAKTLLELAVSHGARPKGLVSLSKVNGEYVQPLPNDEPRTNIVYCGKQFGLKHMEPATKYSIEKADIVLI